ncbi:MAG TPA: glycoside hydrolase family 6 protein [Streptosporangiaceae bacterium]|nr:glycoside hydrolase family 6 protein [Streptosporangiaceae bacterium]
MRRARIIAAAVATLLVGSSAVAATVELGSTADAASTGCSVAYQVQSDWGTGFSLGLTVTNNGPAITGWTVSYTYSGNQALTQGWSGNWSQSGETMTITNLSWNGSLATGGTANPGGNFSYTGTNTAPTSISCSVTLAGGSSPSPSPSSSPSSSPSPSPSSSPSPSPSPTPTPTPTGSCGSGLTLQANPSTFSVAQGKTEVFGVSLNESPTASIPVTVAETSGNSGLSVSSGSSITESSSDWNLPQPVYIAANASGTGATTFTISAPGCTSVTVTGTETTAGSGTTPSHVVNPFTGASWYVNPNYTAEADSSAASASGTLAAQMEYVGTQPTFIWLDHIGAIYGGSDNASGINGTQRTSLAAQLQTAVTDDSSGAPMIFPIVIYDLPDRDCDALASNGELSIANNGLSYYEHSYIDPIAQILSDYQNTNLRIVAVIEPDSLPNLVTNSSVTNCAAAQSSGVYTTGIEYALNKLHAIANVYNYLDIAHSAWLGWPANMTPAVSLFHQVAAATTDGVSSVDGFISDTANTIPVSEPYMTATESVDSNPVDSVQYYSYDPFIDELTYDEAMYTNLVSAGFSANVGMLIDTSRDGWGDPSLRPTAACSTTTCTTTAEFVNSSKIDERPFRGDWCNPENAGIGAVPQANPNSSFTHLYAYVWVKPPGESDGTYPAYSGTGDPHCDPNGTQTDGSGNTYPTDAIPDSPPAGHWFPVEFSQLVSDAYPAIP